MPSSERCLASSVALSFAIDASFGNSAAGFASIVRAVSCTSSVVAASSVALSAIRWRMAWKVPTGRPNCSRCLT